MVYKSEKSNRGMKSKEKQRKRLWSPEEDEKLRSHVLKYGHACWTTIPIQAGLQRNGKSCRLRWVNYLRPGLKKGLFTKEEETTLVSLHSILGNRWSKISKYLPGRTDNEIKNYCHSYLKKSRPTTTRIPQTPSNNAPISTFSPSLLFSEWLDQSLVTDHSIQDLIVPEEKGFIGTYAPDINYSLIPNSEILLEDEISEIELYTSFSDNILFEGLIDEQPAM